MRGCVLVHWCRKERELGRTACVGDTNSSEPNEVVNARSTIEEAGRNLGLGSVTSEE